MLILQTVEGRHPTLRSSRNWWTQVRSYYTRSVELLELLSGTPADTAERKRSLSLNLRWFPPFHASSPVPDKPHVGWNIAFHDDVLKMIHCTAPGGRRRRFHANKFRWKRLWPRGEQIRADVLEIPVNSHATITRTAAAIVWLKTNKQKSTLFRWRSAAQMPGKQSSPRMRWHHHMGRAPTRKSFHRACYHLAGSKQLSDRRAFQYSCNGRPVIQIHIRTLFRLHQQS